MNRWLLSAIVLLTTGAFCPDGAADPIWDSLAGGISVNSVRTNIVTAPLNAPPVGGFVPQVIVSLTDEKAFDVFDTAVSNSSQIGGQTLPAGGAQHFAVALFDTGAQANVFRDDEMQIFDLSSVDRVGINTQVLSGVAGSETAFISDPVGVYIAGFDAINGTSPLTVSSSALMGQQNVSILTGEPGSILPNVIGIPIAHQYTTILRNDRPQQVTVGSETFETPLVTIVPRGANQQIDVETQFSAALDVVGAEAITAPTLPPVFFGLPDFEDPLAGLHNDPLIPTVQGVFMMEADVSHNGLSQLDQPFLLDFGAQITVISKEVANDVDLDVDAPGFVPDFTVEIEGAGGVLEDVPGVFLDSLNLDVTGGDLNYTNVPVVVINLPNPDGSTTPLPGIVGTNLFTDRNLVLNPGASGFNLRISNVIPEPGSLGSLVALLAWSLMRRAAGSEN